MTGFFRDKNILITGGTGSWARELTKQLLRDHNPKEIRIYSRGELKQVEMRREFNSPKLKFIIGDVRDKNRLNYACRGVEFIFHLAALKHVPVCEENPEEAVKTNITGTQNVVECAINNNVSRVVDVSTDKAVDPLNLYGVTKLCGEKIAIAANKLTSDTVFTCVRGGNVMGTTGSVIPLFRKQIETTNVVTITDKRMTRFLLSIPDAIRLVLEATTEAVGGETFVMKMPAANMVDLAEVMIEELGNDKTKMTEIGIRPGEKIDEVLVSRYECDRVIDHGEFFIILPHLNLPKIKEAYKDKKLHNMCEYNSKNTHQLSKLEIKELLDKQCFLTQSNFKYGDILDKLTKEQLERIAKEEKWVL